MKGSLVFYHFTILPFDGVRDGYTVIFHQKTAFMVKKHHFRVGLRQYFVCVGVFTGNAHVFLRTTQASLCGGLRVVRTGVSYLRKWRCLGCGNGGTPTMFKVAVKR